MLSAQHRDLAEKKPPIPYPKHDFSRWNTLDYFTRPSRFKASRFWLTVRATALVAACCSLSIAIPKLHGMHQASPVSTAHAMFNQNCANCHRNAWRLWRECLAIAIRCPFQIKHAMSATMAHHTIRKSRTIHHAFLVIVNILATINWFPMSPAGIASNAIEI